MIKSTTFITKWVYAVVRITLMWWIANFPYLILIFASFGVENEGQIGTLMLTGLVFLPFIMVPSTIGTLGVAREFFKRENDFPLFLTYWKYVKREYVTGMKVGMVIMILMSLFYLQFSYYSMLLGTSSGLVFILFMFMAVFYFIFLLTILVDRSNSLIGYFKVTGQLMSRHPVLMISMMLESFLVIYLSAIFMPSLLIFGCPGIIVLLATHFYRECIRQEERKETLSIREDQRV
ncbi:DUF624 domain-containing protein [Mesobacillus foraminis]|uniref:Putative membrane protein YesL n=1 Tax=Mesobacillus foraminis TaxID=279826 RepID=A0A4R2B2C2_9BACI|nr:DUF624 domain-containing protein [Mesobacillus foraminis]TCN19712.1 putative membrane protein YesL [Mesobacillus foraminis]